MPKQKQKVKTKVSTLPSDPELALSLALTYYQDGARFTAAIYANHAISLILNVIANGPAK